MGNIQGNSKQTFIEKENPNQDDILPQYKKDETQIETDNMNQPITLELLKQVFNKYYWSRTPETNLISEYIGLIYSNCHIDWSRVTQDKKLNHALMEEFAGKLDWFWLSQYGVFSDETHNKFTDNFIWSIYCQRPDISEESRIKAITKVSDEDLQKYANSSIYAWNYIKKCPNLSKLFLLKNKEVFIAYQRFIRSKDSYSVFDALLSKLPEVNPISGSN